MGDGVLSPDDPKPPTGCDYEPCETAVCGCDSYCCESAWDLSCRGYYMKAGDTIENNYFVPGCSAKLLCCEQESAFPDPPIGAAMGPLLANAVQVVGPAFVQEMTEYSCEPGSAGCCDTMKPPSYLPPDDSTCWQWWDPPADGILPDGAAPPPKGCDYEPCEAAVCACDPYCCESAWDLSCRGYHLNPEDTVNNNYFVDQCSAKILCCEPESAYPDPPVGGASGEISIETEIVTPFQCDPSQPISGKFCCETMVPPSFLPPADSSCWDWWTPPADGILPAGVTPPKGCDYTPCQDAVCACDSYCCTTAWDESCRGYDLQPGDTVQNNYFVDGCSAEILCCNNDMLEPTKQLVKEIIKEEIIQKIPVPQPVPVEVPVTKTVYKEVEVQVIKEVPITKTVYKPVPVPVPQKKVIPVPVPVPVTVAQPKVVYKPVPVPVTVAQPKVVYKPVPVAQPKIVYQPVPVVPAAPPKQDINVAISTEASTTTKKVITQESKCVCPPVPELTVVSSTTISQTGSKSKGKSGKGKSGKAGSKGKKCGKSGKGKAGSKGSKSKSKSSKSSDCLEVVSMTTTTTYGTYTIAGGCQCKCKCPSVFESSPVQCIGCGSVVMSSVAQVTSAKKSKGKAGKGKAGSKRVRQ